MPESHENLEIDFDAQLRGLFQEAEQDIETRAAAAFHTEPSEIQNAMEEVADEPIAEPLVEPLANMAFAKILRPILARLEKLERASGNQTFVLDKLDERLSGIMAVEKDLPKIVAEMQGVLETRNAVSHQMFDALHEELRGYKDGFLLETVHRPIIRDIISIYDELLEIHRQMSGILEEHAEECRLPFFSRLQTLASNVDHNIAFVVEVLARLEVVPIAPGTGKLDKRTQRTVSLEFVENLEEDSTIARSVKCGFLWRERLFRPEEVVTKKWKDGLLKGGEPVSPTQALAP